VGRAKRKILLLVGIAVFSVGMIIGVGWEIVGWLGGSRLSKIEFPFCTGDHLAVSVDSAGRIYVGDSDHSRIQRYSPTGQFEMGWFVATKGAAFILRTTTADNILIAAARHEGVLTYTANGQLLRRVPDEDGYTLYSASRETSGNYRLRGFLFPRVVDMRTGRTVVAMPWTKRLVAAPFPSLAYSGLGVALVAVSEWQRRRGRARLRPSSSL
jgi:hypothetical protein